MTDSIRTHDPLDHWHRRLCPITEWLVLSGDLHPLRPRAEAQVEAWRTAGLTAVIDTREEWTDEALVAEIAPELRYWHLGTEDDGRRKNDAWFDAGVEAYRQALTTPCARLLVHCHMGINRGPSMGYRLLLEAGESPIAALQKIRRARPIAAVAYAGDALNHFHRSSNASARVRERDLARLRDWMAANGIDLDSLLRRTRTEVA
jgi:dual specificity phosphatase 3